jgi:hypothetical protein
LKNITTGYTIFEMKEGFLAFLRGARQDQVNRAAHSFNTEQTITSSGLQIKIDGSNSLVGIKLPGQEDDIYKVNIVRDGQPINIAGAPLTDEEVSEFNKFGKGQNIPLILLHSGDPTQPTDKIMGVIFQK